jgi:hypothetical protein
MIKSLPILLVVFILGCATMQYDELNAAFLAGDISLEQYDQAVNQLAPSVLRESAYSYGPGPLYWPYCPPPLPYPPKLP